MKWQKQQVGALGLAFSFFISGARCAFGTRGSFGDRTIDNSAIPFNIVDLNTCDGYDATTGKYEC